MNVILDINISIKGKHLHTMLRKEIQTDLFPFPGIQIEDSAWKEPKLPVATTCNFDEGYYLLNFKTIELDTKEDCNSEAEMYRSHDWKRMDECI